MTTQSNEHAEQNSTAERFEQEGPPRGVRAMAFFRWSLVALMAVFAVLSVSYSLGLISGGTASAATQYYCPMHPQIVQDGPGDCPICSMSLVPKGGGDKAGDATKVTKMPSIGHDGHEHSASDPYYCPMHPEKTSADPNARCPICGMKLEKRSEPKPKSSATDKPSALSEPYYCPMHPEKTSADPNARCPICEMKLEKRPEPKSGTAASAAMPAAPTPVVPGVPLAEPPGLVPVELSLDRIQLVGIRTAPVTHGKLTPELRAVAQVAADEAKLARVHTRFSGWIEGLAVATTGQKVKRGQVLASIFNVELLPAQQEFLAAQRWTAQSAGAAQPSTTAGLTAPLEQDARARLELLGLSRWEIDQVSETGKPTRTVAVTAPIGGYVVNKAAVKGGYVDPGMQLFEIADLSKVWALADIYEYELGRVAIGQAAYLEVSAYPGQRFSGKIGLIYPTVDPNTRTVRVRIELDNKEMNLKPGMYGNVVIQLADAAGFFIPDQALVDTGEHQYVFVAQEGGKFLPRSVRVGPRSDGRVQILQGLAEGEKVVTTANFLLDSESRLRAVIEGAPAQMQSPP